MNSITQAKPSETMSSASLALRLPVLVSSCLLGKPVRYDGRHAQVCHPVLERWQQQGRLRILCPEVAGGLPIPRPPVEIEPGKSARQVLMAQARVQDPQGQDMSESFRQGAQLAVDLARREGIKLAILKEGSPSCGSSLVADGHFLGHRIAGQGVTAAALEQMGVRVFSEKQLDAADAYLKQLEEKPL